MRARIHRGTREIGGTCVELEHEGVRIALDCGLPLDASTNSQNLLPKVPGFTESDPSLLGVILSHCHRDHWGLLPNVKPDLPIITGEATARIMSAAAPFVPGAYAPSPVQHLRDRISFELGPFRITPFLVDHSAYDCHALLIEAGGRRLFYTADIRGHGRKSKLFERLLNAPPTDIDTLLMEGSVLGRLDALSRFDTEAAIESQLVELCGRTPGLVLTAASAQNIDRVVSIFRAARRSGRKLVIDLYAAEILAATGNASIPQSSWPDVALWTPQSQRVWIKQNERFDLLDRHKTNRIFPEQLATEPGKYVVLYRGLMLRDLKRAEALAKATAVWSQWAGYLDVDYGRGVQTALGEAGVHWGGVIHTSGHADIPDLQRLARAIAPKRLVPIHTFQADKFPELFSNVTVQKDGEWWDA